MAGKFAEFPKLEQNCKESLCKMFSDSELWSESLISQALRKGGLTTYDIKDVQMIVRNYLSVLSEHFGCSGIRSTGGTSGTGGGSERGSERKSKGGGKIESSF